MSDSGDGTQEFGPVRVESMGGPLVVVPVSAPGHWGGCGGGRGGAVGGGTGRPDDYARVCAVGG
ncbi:hypothetical protein [Kitasatospora sp. NPDC057500]|uniref:hypothetical protein n=1 Tax=Kitasatospora sp. NPDC057500 TaxID=3346151 RepID=UPI0036756685